MNHATIARRIQSLEATLGEKLVERRPEGYVLTSAGTRALAAAGDMESSGRCCGAAARTLRPRAWSVSIASPALSMGFLVAQLAVLPALYPGLDIDLGTDLRAVSLERHEADIAIRLDRPKDGDFLARQLGTMAYGYYGTPEVCRQVEQGAVPVFVGFDESNAYLPDAAWLARAYPGARGLPGQ